MGDLSRRERQTQSRWSRPLNEEGLVVTVFLFIVAAVAVGVALVLGLKNMMLGGSGQVSQKLMRMRVTLQAIAVFVIMAVLWWNSASGT